MITEIPIGIIELGDINIKCVIFKINNNNDSKILSTSITNSEGIHNDVVVNLKKASDAIKKSIKLLKREDFKNYNIIDLRVDGRIIVE